MGCLWIAATPPPSVSSFKVGKQTLAVNHCSGLSWLLTLGVASFLVHPENWAGASSQLILTSWKTSSSFLLPYKIIWQTFPRIMQTHPRAAWFWVMHMVIFEHLQGECRNWAVFLLFFIDILLIYTFYWPITYTRFFILMHKSISQWLNFPAWGKIWILWGKGF